jgi:hypothetical protein
MAVPNKEMAFTFTSSPVFRLASRDRLPPPTPRRRSGIVTRQIVRITGSHGLDCAQPDPRLGRRLVRWFRSGSCC